MRLRCFHRGNPATDHVTEAADAQKTPQAEGHRFSVERRAVVESNPSAQGDGDRQAVGAHPGCRGCQAWFEFTVAAEAVKRITQGTEQLQRANGAGLGRVQRRDLAGGCDGDAIRAIGRAAAHTGHQSEADRQRQKPAQKRNASNRPQTSCA